MNQKFCICKCIFTKNYFIRDLNLHVIYEHKDSFLKQYSELLISKNCTNIDYVVNELEEELARRKKRYEEGGRRYDHIQTTYTRLHPRIYTLSKTFLDSRFLHLVDSVRNDAASNKVNSSTLKDLGHRIYSLPVFTPQFCSELVEEIRNFNVSNIPKSRPNTMNRYGISLDELGFEPFITELRLNYVVPLARILYPDWGGGELDSHKAFIVKYHEEDDVDLAYHYDNAEVTLNVSLNEQYSEGDLYFGPMKDEDSNVRSGYSHLLGHGVLHRGQHMHGALPISEGERYNMIIWFRSSNVRNNCCPMCNDVPQLMPVSHGSGDGFIDRVENVCTAS